MPIPYLTARYAAAKVRGHQGADIGAPDRIAACAKHFAAYGGVEGGRDYNTVDVSEQRLRNLYLPPFKAAIDAGAATVMAAFTTISGIPAHGNAHTMTDILKVEWGFDGVVVSDWAGVHELITHGHAVDGADDLGFWTGDQSGRFVVEPGAVDIYTGTSSTTEAKRTLTIT